MAAAQDIRRKLLDKLKELFGAYDVCCMPTITEFLAVMTEGLCCGRGGRRA